MIYKVLSLTFAIGLLLSPVSGWTYDPKAPVVVSNQTPKELLGVGIDEKLGATIDLSLPFVDDMGNPVTLGQYFTGVKPVLLSIVYYNCPSLCNLHLNGLTEALRNVDWNVGTEFELVLVSMDAKETAAVAGPKKANYVKSYGRLGTINGWHLLTGNEENIKKLAQQVGFNYRWDEATAQFAHASAGIILTSGGKVSRYLHGIQPSPKDLRLSLLEASNGKIGSIIDKIVMLCFHFDPKKSKYTIYAWNIMQFGAMICLLVFAIILIPAWVRERTSRGVV